MTTNLLIGYPDIPFRASAPTLVSGTEDSTLPATNAISGGRAQCFTLSSAAGVTDFKCDLGAATTAAINFLYVARGLVLKKQGSTAALLSSSTDDITYTPRIGTTSALQTRTFTGPQGDDLFFASGFNDDVAGTLPTSAFRYWRFRYGVSSPTKKWFFSKLYFGTLFDMGRDPVIESMNLSCSVRENGNREPRMNFTLKWEGITNTIRNSFISNIYRWREVNPVVLYDTNNYIFNGAKTIHCSILKAEISNRTAASSDLTAEFEEQV
jgi:hypothetical protein